jgi:hypothetical protein
MSTTVETATAIRPFHVDVSDEALEDLRRRVAATNWPEKETVGDQSQGVPLAGCSTTPGLTATRVVARRSA